MTWVALHEVTHAVQFAGVPWLHGYVSGLVQELLKSAEIRLDAPRRLRPPSRAEARRVLAALRRGDLVSILTNEGERGLLDRVQAVMAVIEGHAEHVMDVVAPDLVPSLSRLREALDRRRRSQSAPVPPGRPAPRARAEDAPVRPGQALLRRGRGPGGVAALHHVFSGPEALPTLVELDDPAAWLARTAAPVSQLAEARAGSRGLAGRPW